MRPLSIGVFSYSTKPRGSVVHAAALAEALMDAGQDVTLYVLDKDGEGFYRPLRTCCQRMPAGAAAPGSDGLIAQRIGEVAAFVDTARPRHDLVHAEDCLVASGLLAARASLGGALLCRTVHHVEAFESPYLEACQARSIRQAELVLSVSQATRADVLSHYGCHAHVVLNGVDFRRFDCARSRSPAGVDDLGLRALALRSRLGIPAHAPLVVSVGGIEPRKNSLVMLHAFARAREAWPELRWLIAGGASIFEHAEYRAQFEQALRALPPALQAAVVQLGVLEDEEMPALYAAGDALLHAARQEGFGLCVLEAMASGCPVVVSRGAPFDEYLDDGCAERVDPGQPTDVARGLMAALQGRPDRVLAARARAAELSWTRCAERHLALYRAALAERGAAPNTEKEQVHA